MAKIRITDAVDIDLDKEMWCCHSCGAEINSARESYLKGCLVHERPADEVYGAPFTLSKETSVAYAPNPDFMRLVEFYCPGCGAMTAVQYLPPGHPIPEDIRLDIDKLKKNASKQQK